MSPLAPLATRAINVELAIRATLGDGNATVEPTQFSVSRLYPHRTLCGSYAIRPRLSSVAQLECSVTRSIAPTPWQSYRETPHLDHAFYDVMLSLYGSVAPSMLHLFLRPACCIEKLLDAFVLAHFQVLVADR